jgi:hypothetical protein
MSFKYLLEMAFRFSSQKFIALLLDCSLEINTTRMKVPFKKMSFENPSKKFTSMFFPKRSLQEGIINKSFALHTSSGSLDGYLVPRSSSSSSSSSSSRFL